MRGTLAMADGGRVVPSPPIRRKASYRALQTSLLPPQRSGGGHNFSCEPPWEDERGHFLDACFLCRAPLRASRDIYMYRGDTPFCSEECRQEQMELDEAREREASAHRRRWQHSAAPSSVEQGATPASGQRLRGPAADAIFAS